MSALSPDHQAILLTLELAAVSTAIVLLLATPLAWWLAARHERQPTLASIVAAIVSLPLVLPPTVLGFYLLLLMGPSGAIGRLTTSMGLGTLAFTFEGLVIASVLATLPFVLAPLQAAFAGLGEGPLEAAATLRASPLDRFLRLVVPACTPAFIGAGVLAFAHVVGEFGIVLMIGGSIPGQTRVVSVALYDHVQGFEMSEAHALAATLLGFSAVALFFLYRLGMVMPYRAASRRP